MVRHTTGAAASPVRASVDRPPAKPRVQDQDERNSGKRLSNGEDSGDKSSGTQTQELRLRNSGTPEGPSCPPFCSAGLRPIAPPRSLLHLPSRRFEKPLEKGRSSSLTASHHASTNRGRAAPPRPFSPSASGFRRKHQAGTFRREIQVGDSGGRPPPRPPQEPSVQQSCVPHPSRGDRCRVVHGGRRS